MTFDELRAEAETAVCESAGIDFKGQFDVSAKADWCELIKDIAAITNSGGGCIVFGLDDEGQPTGLDCTDVVGVDPADITNQLHANPDNHSPGFRLASLQR